MMSYALKLDARKYDPVIHRGYGKRLELKASSRLCDGVLRKAAQQWAP